MAQNFKKKGYIVFRENKKKQRKKKRKKENGAHNHRSYCKFRSVQNIHVMLSYAKITKNSKETNLMSDVKTRAYDRFEVSTSDITKNEEKKKKREKKTEHTIISHTARDLEHQNIHVMFFYAIITIKYHSGITFLE